MHQSPVNSALSSPLSPHVLVDIRFKAQQRGGDRCRFELAGGLHDQGRARYTFLTYADTEAILLKRCPGAVTTSTTCKPNEHPRGDFFEHVRLPLRSRRLQADIYHGTFNVVPVLPMLRPAPVTLLTVHDMAVFAHPEAYGRKFAMYGRKIVKAGIRRATSVIAISKATASEIVKYVPGVDESKIVVISNGVGEEFAAVSSLEPTAARAALGRLRIPSPYVLFVGNLERKKNLPRLIEAFQAAKARAKLRHTLVIVGEALAKGPDSGLPAGATDGGDIHFTGYIEDKDLPILYRGADLVAYPSIYEGFGMPVLEGMAAGVPVLTSSVSSLPEVAGGAALLVDPFDVEHMTAGLERALSDVGWRAFAREAGLARAATLPWAENARKTAELYLHLAERDREAFEHPPLPQPATK